MKSTISDIRYIFNVKALAKGKAIDALQPGELGIFSPDAATSTSATTFAGMPKEFNFVLNTGKGMIISPWIANKNRIVNPIEKAPTTAQPEIWETTITNCECTKGFSLKVHIDETTLMNQEGFNWGHQDTHIGMTSEEMDCYCQDGEFISTEDNNRVTVALAKKIIAANSPYYTAKVMEDVEGVDTEVTDLDSLDGSANVKLQIVGKNIPTEAYGTIETNYVHLRGVKLTPVITLNDGRGIEFTKIQELEYAVGEGYDLKAEEWDNMNTYTTLNYQTRLSDGLPSNNIYYQFEDGKSYHTFTMEYDRDKQDRAGEGDKNRILLVFASETEAIINELATKLTP